MEPTWISDSAIPLLAGGFLPQTGSNTSPVTSDSQSEVPKTNVDHQIPVAFIAQETVSQSLNTETKRILADYSFESLGAISIYSSTFPLAHISISGDGIVAYDSSGNPTVTIDGETGDATFKGEVLAGSLVSGSVTVGDGTVVIDGANSRIDIFNSLLVETVRLDDTGLNVFGTAGDVFKIYDQTGGTLYGKMGYNTSASFDHAITLDSRGSIQLSNYDGSGNFATLESRFALGYLSPNFQDFLLTTIHGDGHINAGGDILVTCNNFKINGSTKTAIVPLADSYVALYAIEAPEVWFMDFCQSKDMIDPKFLAVTEGDMHFIALDSEIGYQVWRRRKGHAQTRFEQKTQAEFYKNEAFLGMSKLDN